ncbi:MAG: hypothetical protein QF733_10140 [Phycisphaerales bacterium]|jgi:hypothetical protein|nr:hypothetical protein [Phycisphaerales bacterium]
MSESKVPTFPPIAGFGAFFCCVGVIWTFIVQIQQFGAVNDVLGSKKLSPIAAIVPIWCYIETWNAWGAMHEICEAKQLKVDKVEGNLVLLILLGPIEIFRQLTYWNAIAEACNAE